MKNNKNKVISIVLAVVMAVTLCGAFTAFGDETETTTISIGTAEELKEFAGNCRLDSWSVGKYVELTDDIDLTDTGFLPIPVFGGTFNGNGYCISGLSLDADTSSQGLFRYITQDGLVENLTVTGYLSGAENQEYLGGITGSLEGTVRNCRFEGTIDGSFYVGGIAGVNHKTGRIEFCIFKGNVSGEQFTGGIAGENNGVIANSENHGRVNTSSKEDIELETVLSSNGSGNVLKQAGETLDKVRTVSEVSQDTGGIAGYSTGIISDCLNKGVVGYEHIGYNVGGIAGRSSGYLSGCRNENNVNGRKDVGGICGQMVPDIKLVFSEDTLDRLDDELNTLRNLADHTSSHTSANRKAVSDRLDQISEYTRMASDNTADLAEMSVDWADANLEELNRLSDAVDETVYRMEQITENGAYALKSMGDGLDALETGIENAGELFAGASDNIDGIRENIEILRECRTQMKTSQEQIKKSISALFKAGAESDAEAAIKAAETIAESARNALRAVETYNRTLKVLREKLKDIPDTDGMFDDSLRSLTEAAEAFSGAAEEVEDVADEIHRMFKSLSKRDPIEMKTFGDDYQDKGDQLHASVNAIGDQLDFLKEEADRTGDDLSDDVNKMRDQLKVISDLLQDAATEVRDRDKNDYWKDVSEEDIRNTTIGKAESCTNYGVVEGDINVGGIAGVMDIERGLDPEDDIKEEGNESLDFHYETRVILESCINNGTVRSKKNYAGGVCGRMSLGYILACNSFADVSSSDGDYVGGIAGQSTSTIRKSYSKGTLSGNNYVGGICGFGYDLYENTAFVRIEDASMYSGAVAGYVEADGILSANRFVENNTAGVDGISYQGKAEPVLYEEVIAEEETPKEFQEFRLTYLADDAVIASVLAGHGKPVSAYPVPAVPKKSGYHAVWTVNMDDIVTFDRIIEARYIPYKMTLASETQRDSVHAVILAEGAFMENETLCAESLAAENTREQWRISLLLNEEAAEPVNHTFRFCIPEGWEVSDLMLRVPDHTEDQTLAWTQDGRVCVFETPETEFTLTAIRKDSGGIWRNVVIISFCIAAGAVSVGIYNSRFRGKGRRKTK